MARGDTEGRRGRYSKERVQKTEIARARQDAWSMQSANINVGDFVSELATAIRYRMKAGLTQGDWIEEPERCMTDGRCFAEEVAVATNVKLQLTLSLDTSTSMWTNGLMKYAGPSFQAIDSIIRSAAMDLPEGTLHYAPFIFSGLANQIPPNWISKYNGFTLRNKVYLPPFPFPEEFQQAKSQGLIPEAKRLIEFPIWSADTKIEPLFRAIQDWEQTSGDASATRLDIVITDGVLEDRQDVEEATRVQDDRNGRLRTIFLNFLDPKEWGRVCLPDRCTQYAVTPENLDSSLRDILTETVADLLP